LSDVREWVPLKQGLKLEGFIEVNLHGENCPNSICTCISLFRARNSQITFLIGEVPSDRELAVAHYQKTQ
jgi:hypothetical protein